MDQDAPSFCNKEGGCGYTSNFFKVNQSWCCCVCWCVTLVSPPPILPLLIFPCLILFLFIPLTFISDACFGCGATFNNTNDCVLPAHFARVAVLRDIHARHRWQQRVSHATTPLGTCTNGTRRADPPPHVGMIPSLYFLFFWFFDFTDGCLGTTSAMTVFSGARNLSTVIV